MAMADQPPAALMRTTLLPPDWKSGLPLELLELIAKKLPSGQDAAAFRSTCSRWRRALPFSTFAPLLLLSPVDDDRLPESPAEGAGSVAFLRLTAAAAAAADDETKTAGGGGGGGRLLTLPLPEVRGRVACGASCGWLALMDEAASVVLVNPFTGGRVALPPADGRIAAASLRCVEMVGGRWVDQNAPSSPIRLADVRDVFFSEIVLSAPPNRSGGDACVAMAVLANSTEVAFCRVGDDNEWTILDTGLECSVASVVYCQGRFIAVSFLGEISIFSSNIAGAGAAGATAPTATPLPSLNPPAQVCNRSYLEMNGQLHLVGAILRVYHTTRSFTYHIVVYKCGDLLDGEMPAWSKVTDAGDMAVFVSKRLNASFSGVSVSKINSNHIYFSEPLYYDCADQEEEGGDNIEQYVEMVDITNGTSEFIAHHSDMEGSEALSWFRPNPWT